jgi:hypothetical protein
MVWVKVPVPCSAGPGQHQQGQCVHGRRRVPPDPMTLAWSSGRAVVRRYPHRQSRGPTQSLPVDWFFQPIWCCRYILKKRKLGREPRRPGVVLPWGGRDSVSLVVQVGDDTPRSAAASHFFSPWRARAPQTRGRHIRLWSSS